MKFKHLIALIVIAVLGWFAYNFFHDEEQAIRNQLESLAESLRIEAKVPHLEALKLAKATADHFTDNFEVDVAMKYRRPQKMRSQRDLVQAVGYLRSNIDRLHVEFLDTQIKFLDEGDRAEIHTTAKAHFQDPDHFEVLELEMTMTKDSGDWLVEQVKTVEAIEF